jgi:hypothetical protein
MIGRWMPDATPEQIREWIRRAEQLEREAMQAQQIGDMEESDRLMAKSRDVIRKIEANGGEL